MKRRLNYSEKNENLYVSTYDKLLTEVRESKNNELNIMFRPNNELNIMFRPNNEHVKKSMMSIQHCHKIGLKELTFRKIEIQKVTYKNKDKKVIDIEFTKPATSDGYCYLKQDVELRSVWNEYLIINVSDAGDLSKDDINIFIEMDYYWSEKEYHINILQKIISKSIGELYLLKDELLRCQKEKVKMNVICFLLGHHEQKIDDIKMNDDLVVTDDIKVSEFSFPVVKHRFRCKRCMKIRETYPDIPGSMDGTYKVHYN